MGHRAGTRHDGGQGTLKARRAVVNKTLTKVLESEARRAVRELAEQYTLDAVRALAATMYFTTVDSARVLASRELLKLAEAYTPADREGWQGPAGDARPVFQINIMSTQAELPRMVEVIGLPAQQQLTAAPLTQPLDPDVSSGA